jgi:hypothetical protein
VLLLLAPTVNQKQGQKIGQHNYTQMEGIYKKQCDVAMSHEQPLGTAMA